MELRDIRGIGPAYAKRLNDAHVHDAEDLAWVDDLAHLADKTGIPPARLAAFQAEAVRLVASQRHRPPSVALRGITAALVRLRDEVTRAVETAWRNARRAMGRGGAI